MEILYKYAADATGNVVHISKALKGESYYCPDCKDNFILKKGNIRQYHFAHSHTSANCNSEGYLHKTFKKLLSQKLKEHVEKNTQLVIEWICNICGNKHTADLIKNINDVKEEQPLIGCRPDISLIDKIGIISIIIEIVDTHEPERNVIEFCQNNNVVLIIIKLESLSDLENVEKKIKTPTSLFYFNKMSCITYYNHALQQHNMQQQLATQMRVRTPNRILQRGPRIDEVVAKHERQQRAIRNNYSKKSRRK